MSDLGTVVPFVPRQIGGDWSSTERERLAELAERLTARGARVDAAYGVSDRGDPWCVITDDRDEVMVHVARIDGRFIVHDAASDAIQDEDTLWRAFERLLGRAWREGRSAAVVTPLRDAQSLLALMAAIVFVHEIDRALPTLHASPGPHTSALGDLLGLLHPPAAAGAERTTSLEAAKPAHAQHAQGAPGHGATAGHPESSLVLGQTDGHHPVQAPAADRTPGHGGEGVIRVSDDHGAVLVGGPGDDLLIGGRGGDHLMGGAGADTLDGGGARPGELDVLEGGAGDDQIRLAARTVAIGGEGHNVFVVTASNAAAGKAEPARGPVDAGVVLDFTAQDRFEFTGSLHPTVVSVEAEQDVLSGLHGFAALARTTATPGFRVGFDLNGDGRADVYVTVSGPAASSLTQGWRPEGSPLQSTPEHSLGLGGGHHTPAAGAFVLGS